MTVSDPVIETARGRFVSVVRDLTIGGLAGVVSGFIVGGVGGRIAMRLTSLVAPAEAIGRQTEGGFIVGTVTFDGTLQVLFFVGSFGLLGGLLLVILWPWVHLSLQLVAPKRLILTTSISPSWATSCSLCCCSGLCSLPGDSLRYGCVDCWIGVFRSGLGDRQSSMARSQPWHFR